MPAPIPTADATHPPAPLMLPAGTRLQEFEVTGVVGEGGFGIVYEATDTLLNRRVAIKEYMPSQLAARVGPRTVRIRSAEFAETFSAGLRSFINEARMLAQFKHQALVEVFRFWEENGTAYMVMPLYEGTTLKNHLTHNPDLPSERWLLSLLTPVLDALDQMHGLQVFHRDISPDNLLILKNGSPMLLDLGAARRVIGNGTQAMTVILKPGYAPIEQYGEDDSMQQGAWTDIYALAALVYFAIMRKPPPAAVSRLVKDPIRPLVQVAPPGFSENFLATVDRALAVRPEARPQSIDAFRSGLGIAISASVQTSEMSARGAAAAPASAADRVPAATLTSPATDFRDIDKTIPFMGVDAARSAEQAVPAAEQRAMAASPERATRTLPTQATVATAPPQESAVLPDSHDVSNQSPAGAVAPHRTGTRSRTPLLIGAVCVALVAGVVGGWSSRSPAPSAAPSAAPPTDPSAKTQAMAAQPVSPAFSSGSSNLASGTATPADSPSAPTPNPVPAPSATDSSNRPGTPPASRETASISADTPAPAEQRGVLRVAVRPWAEVYIDGAARGISPPLKRLSLPPGSYQVELRNPAGPAYTRRIEIQRNQSVDIDHQF